MNMATMTEEAVALKGTAPLNILIVDDEPTIRETCGEVVTSSIAPIRVAATAESIVPYCVKTITAGSCEAKRQGTTSGRFSRRRSERDCALAVDERQGRGRRWRRVSLNQVVSRTIDLQEISLASAKVTVEVDLDEALPFVLGDAGQLQQVLMNLVGTARQAIEQRGNGGTARNAWTPAAARNWMSAVVAGQLPKGGQQRLEAIALWRCVCETVRRLSQDCETHNRIPQRAAQPRAAH